MSQHITSYHIKCIDSSSLFPTPSRAFSRYDVDCNGYITVEDLRRVFASQGKQSTEAELREWVRRRDSTGRNAVSFLDFSEHYQ